MAGPKANGTESHSRSDKDQEKGKETNPAAPCPSLHSAFPGILNVFCYSLLNVFTLNVSPCFGKLFKNNSLGFDKIRNAPNCMG